MQQLAIPIPLPYLPTTITLRTQTSKYHLGDYQPGYCWDKAADNTPMMETHFVYDGDEYIGCMNRIFADLPWRIAARGELEAKTCDTDMHTALNALIEWHNKNKAADATWINSIRYCGITQTQVILVEEKLEVGR